MVIEFTKKGTFVIVIGPVRLFGKTASSLIPGGPLTGDQLVLTLQSPPPVLFQVYVLENAVLIIKQKIKIENMYLIMFLIFKFT